MLLAAPRTPQGGGDCDGLPTLARIRALYTSALLPMPPVVFLSGESDPRDHERFAAAGATQVLVKPASLENLSALRALVQLRSLTDGGGGNGGSTERTMPFGGL